MSAKPIPVVSTRLRVPDRLGRWGVRWGIGRGRYRVDPGLYRVGAPHTESPVLVTGNYKLTFDTLRSELEGVAAWILVLDTDGINVWCAAGKGTFGTDELVHRVQSTGLAELVSHRKLVVPQLGATGVAAHEVKDRSGFRVVYGPVRARDLRAFLEAGLRATDEMRRVTFTTGERVALVGVELVTAIKWAIPVVLVMMLLLGEGPALGRLGSVLRGGAPVLMGLLAGTVIVPILLPWIPGRAFSLKGALVGVLVVGATIAVMPGGLGALRSLQMLLLGTAGASFFAMQFTGATTFTSPSGVEWEMRRALGAQLGAVLVAAGLWILA